MNKIFSSWGRLRWYLDEVHPVYGTVIMIGMINSSPYRWFRMNNGTISTIPLSTLNEEDYGK